MTDIRTDSVKFWIPCTVLHEAKFYTNAIENMARTCVMYHLKHVIVEEYFDNVTVHVQM